MRLGRPVYAGASGARLPLLQTDTVITEQLRGGLERAGVFAVYVNDAVSEGITPLEPISPELRDRAIRDLDTTFATVSKTGTVARIPAEQIERLSGLVTSILRELRSRRTAISSLMDLHAFDSHTLGHSLNVCLIGLMIGEESLRRHGWRDGRGEIRHGNTQDRLEKLGLGLLLHDIGKVMIPAEILQKPGRLNEAEMQIVRSHPQSGIDLIEKGSFSALSKVAIIGHHERMDGLGYPFGRSHDLHPHAQIAGIADVYDAVSSMRVYRERRPTHEAWELIMSLAGTAFPLDLVQVFKDTIAPYPEGVAVQLSDGRRGIVAQVNRGQVTRPLVRVTHEASGGAVSPYEIDLATSFDIVIGDTLGDLVGADGTGSGPARSSDERHEQRIAIGSV